MSVTTCAHICELMRVCRCMCQTQDPFFSNQVLSASFRESGEGGQLPRSLELMYLKVNVPGKAQVAA